MADAWARIRDALAGRESQRLPEPTRSRAAVAVVLRDGPQGMEALFIRRAQHPRDPWSGQMAFPGGRAEPSDPNLQATAVRETAEEIGIDLDTDAEYLGPLDEVRAMSKLRPLDLTITPFVFRLHRDAELRLSEEVAAVHWVTLRQLLAPEIRGTYDYGIGPLKLKFPCLRVTDDVVIWGLTYRMFSAFTERCLDQPLAS